MRIYTVTAVCRLGDDGKPAFSLDVEVETGAEAVIPTIPAALHNLADQLAADLASKTGQPVDVADVVPATDVVPEDRQ